MHAEACKSKSYIATVRTVRWCDCRLTDKIPSPTTEYERLIQYLNFIKTGGTGSTLTVYDNNTAGCGIELHRLRVAVRKISYLIENRNTVIAYSEERNALVGIVQKENIVLYDNSRRSWVALFCYISAIFLLYLDCRVKNIETFFQ